MKKLFLFLGAALFSLGVSATEYNVTITSFNGTKGQENNIDFTSQLGGATLTEGDVVNITMKGYFNAPVGVAMNCVADNAYDADGAGGYWNQLSDWDAVDLGKAVIGTEFEGVHSFTITTTALQKTKYIVQVALSIGMMQQGTYGTEYKFRPTEAALSVESKTYEVIFPTLKFGSDGGNNYKAEVLFETDAAMLTDDVLKVIINGKFNQGINALVFMVFDNDGNTVLEWTKKDFQAASDETVEKYVELLMPNDCPTTAGKLGVFIEGYDPDVKISFLKDGDEEHDPVELAKKEYTEVTLAYNQYATPANYQFIEAEIASDVLVGDYVSFSVKGISSAAFTNMIAYLRNPEGYSEISSHVTVAQNIAANGEVTYTGMVEATSAAAKCDLVFEITDEATEGTSIVIAPEGTVVHEGVELAEKAFSNLTLTKNEWNDGANSNYQYVEELTAPAEGFLKGDYVSFSIKGVATHDITKLQVVIINDSYEGVSEYVTIAENVKEGDAIDFSKKLVLNGASEVCKLSITTTDEAYEGVDAISIEVKTALDEVSAPVFAVEGGMVYSAGEIVVYNVAGKAIASAFQAFNVNSLGAGVYFISAQEGTIKFVK